MAKTQHTPLKPLPMYRVPRDLHARATREAARRCRATGQPVTWQQVIREILRAHLPS